jgi:CobQ-like glutamine amidotransferase family enzyme
MITIYKLFPKHLNLNGDAENADILATRLEWAGVAHRLEEVVDEHGLEACIQAIRQVPTNAIVVIGHGSKAALKELETHAIQIDRLFETMLSADVPGIVVGSGLSMIKRFTGSGERSSRAYTLNLDIDGWPTQAIGYLNSNTTDPLVRVERNVILTHLHGPFLAKNQDWATELIRRAGAELQDSKKAELAEVHLAKIRAMPQD